MPKYKIGWSYGYAGTDSEDVVEAEDLEEAQQIAWESAIQSVDSWAEPIDEEE